ncbi:uncharacterized protein LAESUDRAFT_751062 [Laetiporus sulphureus 93-53]|uniref:Uncharacterized protein n=1 Tax=Laetiporus sulphureus 93-53 TaxID=1314785 RepID=A0A165DE28_9APHY|nr:uncharacterized protein LAESUDRAFT_751062 [Laetiporus sulphureus 93-53]KZT04678.1 hypothetical protein LAESUDRAFT_751062 [Laetiporus sulphureus 93-53]
MAGETPATNSTRAIPVLNTTATEDPDPYAFLDDYLKQDNRWTLPRLIWDIVAEFLCILLDYAALLNAAFWRITDIVISQWVFPSSAAVIFGQAILHAALPEGPTSAPDVRMAMLVGAIGGAATCAMTLVAFIYPILVRGWYPSVETLRYDRIWNPISAIYVHAVVGAVGAVIVKAYLAEDQESAILDPVYAAQAGVVGSLVFWLVIVLGEDPELQRFR